MEQNRYGTTFVGGLIMLVAALFLMASWSSYDIIQHGKLVTMQVDSIIPERGKKPAVLVMSYDGEAYSNELRVMEKYRYRAGDQVKVYKKPGEHVLVFPGEHPLVWCILSGGFLIIGGMMVIYTLIDAKKE